MVATIRYTFSVNLVYELFHIEGVSPERDNAATKITQSLDLPRLGSPTLKVGESNLTFNRDFKSGEQGLWGSTAVALSLFINSNYDVLLILEDDVALHLDFVKAAKAYLSKLPKDWDTFYQYVHWWQQQNRYTDEYDIDDEFICKAYQVWGNGCFFLSKQGASRILKEISENGINEPTDWFILKRGLEGTYNNYTLKPNVNNYCHLLGFDTTIQSGE
jgi:GR25 family glycosyltransferase involved in LPS biosynthesis